MKKPVVSAAAAALFLAPAALAQSLGEKTGCQFSIRYQPTT